jgi:integral membrane protein (TIGR01906 family)
VTDRPARIAGAAFVAAATAVVLVALAVLPFLNPVWIGFAQDRAEATAWTGYTPAQLREATDSIVTDLVFGPPDFDVAVAGEPVLNEAERGHMRDVRGVFGGFAVAVVVAGVGLVAAWRASRGSRAWWRAVRAGALALAAGVVAVGVVGFAAFDAAFEVFHRLFFSGNYTFDPRTDRLVQLFPQRFWFETAMAVGGVILVLSVLVAGAATRRLRRELSRTEPTVTASALGATR